MNDRGAVKRIQSKTCKSTRTAVRMPRVWNMLYGGKLWRSSSAGRSNRAGPRPPATHWSRSHPLPQTARRPLRLAQRPRPQLRVPFRPAPAASPPSPAAAHGPRGGQGRRRRPTRPRHPFKAWRARAGHGEPGGLQERRAAGRRASCRARGAASPGPAGLAPRRRTRPAPRHAPRLVPPGTEPPACCARCCSPRSAWPAGSHPPAPASCPLSGAP